MGYGNLGDDALALNDLDDVLGGDGLGFRNVEAGANPVLGGFVILGPATVGERSPPAGRRGVDVTKFGALEAGAESGPGVAGVARFDEGVLVEGEDDEGVAGMIAVDGDVGDVHVVEAVVGGGKRFAAIGADLDAFAFRADDELLGIIFVDDHGVDDPVARSDAPEIFFVGGLPKAAGGAGVESVGIGRIHEHELRAAENVGDALVLDPVGAGVGAVVDAGAGGGVDVFGIGGIDDDAHHVGVIDHALHHREPVLAAVGGLPGQVVGAGVNGVVVLGIESERVKAVADRDDAEE